MKPFKKRKYQAIKRFVQLFNSQKSDCEVGGSFTDFSVFTGRRKSKQILGVKAQCLKYPSVPPGNTPKQTTAIDAKLHFQTPTTLH